MENKKDIKEYVLSNKQSNTDYGFQFELKGWTDTHENINQYY